MTEVSAIETLLRLGPPAIYLVAIWALWGKLNKREATQDALVERYHNLLVENTKQSTLLAEELRTRKD